MRYILRAKRRAAASSLRRVWCGVLNLFRILCGRTILAFLTCCAALFVYSSYITSVNSFFVVDDGVITVHRTYTSDALLALREAGIDLSPQDEVSMPDSPLAGGFAEISIKRGLTVTVDMDGREFQIASGGVNTVRALLHSAGYKPQPRDIVTPPLDTLAEDGMFITVIRYSVSTVQVTEPIGFTVIKNPNRNLNEGTEVVTRPGVHGEKLYSYEVTYENGVEVSRRLVFETVTLDPLPEIVEQGTGKTITTASGHVYRYSKRLECSATAYTTEGYTNKRNAIGNVARVGTIAVDPRVIPLRSKVYVTSANGKWDYGVAICEDTGGAIKGNIVDLFFDTLAECRTFGRRKCIVYILE